MKKITNNWMTLNNDWYEILKVIPKKRIKENYSGSLEEALINLYSQSGANAIFESETDYYIGIKHPEVEFTELNDSSQIVKI